MLDLFLLCILFSGCCCFLFFLLCYLLFFFDFWKPVKNISEKMEIGKTTKMKNAEKKTDILTRAVSTVVFTNSVFFSFLCFFNFCMFC